MHGTLRHTLCVRMAALSAAKLLLHYNIDASMFLGIRNNIPYVYRMNGRGGNISFSALHASCKQLNWTSKMAFPVKNVGYIKNNHLVHGIYYM